jgi:hypothetical protein
MHGAGRAEAGVSDMSSLDIATTSSVRRDETVQVALLLAFAVQRLEGRI